MPLVIFSHPNSPEVNRPWVERTFSRLAAKQRPVLRQIPGPADVRLEPNEVLAVAFPLDTLDPLPHAVDPEVHYELLSKRGLALSGLCTPRAMVLDMAPGTCSEMTCARMIATDPGHAPPGTVLLSDYILSRPLPFVIKLQQSVSGAGTWLVTTPSERREAADCVPRVISHYAPKVEPRAEHLRPCSLIFTELIEDIAATLSPALFVQYGGTPVFLGCTEQQMDQGRWVGGSISYTAQPSLQKRVQRTVDDIARFLWSRGYYGPVGADVLEDSKGNQWIVDLNVRTPSSLVLAVLRTHFWVQRNMDLSRVMPDLRPTVDRDEFVRGLEDEFRAGAVIVIAWVENEQSGANYASVIVGAENPENLDALTKRVCSLCT
ncbi:hypothetical protein AURDEDRAFT_92825 [Auricularia subglabra TFB-10046 SS5]|nr:hypothetical protein AURDEDRAFT_92825 [Auricularia subglabra TFB-10046 SS5]